MVTMGIETEWFVQGCCRVVAGLGRIGMDEFRLQDGRQDKVALRKRRMGGCRCTSEATLRDRKCSWPDWSDLWLAPMRVIMRAKLSKNREDRRNEQIARIAAQRS